MVLQPSTKKFTMKRKFKFSLKIFFLLKIVCDLKLRLWVQKKGSTAYINSLIKFDRNILVS